MKIYDENNSIVVDGENDLILVLKTRDACFTYNKEIPTNMIFKNFNFLVINSFRSKLELIWKILWKKD
jgi:hypothetical protein